MTGARFQKRLKWKSQVLLRLEKVLRSFPQMRSRLPRSLWRWLRDGLLLGAAGATVATLVFTYFAALERQYLLIFTPKDGDVVSGLCKIGGVTVIPFDEVSIELTSSDGTSVWQADEFPVTFDTTNLPDGHYLLIINVYKRAFGFIERLGQTISMDLQIKNSTPVITIHGLREGETVSGLVSVSVEVEGGYVEHWFLDDKQMIWYEEDNITIHSERLGDGIHRLTIVANDRAGNIAYFHLNFNVDNSPPQILTLGLEAGQSVHGQLELLPTIDEPNVSQISWFVDGKLRCTEAAFSWDTTHERDGTHVISLTVVDAGGNVATKEIDVVVDNTPPEIEVEFPTQSKQYYRYSVVPIQVLASEHGRVYLYIEEQKVDEIQIGERPLLLDLSNYPPGSTLRLTIRGVDVAGNETILETSISVEYSLSSMMRAMLTYEDLNPSYSRG